MVTTAGGSAPRATRGNTAAASARSEAPGTTLGADEDDRPPQDKSDALEERDLRAAVRTLAVMVECYLAGRPMGRPPPGGGVDREHENDLREIVRRLDAAARRQRDAMRREAQVRLREVLVRALKPLAKKRRGWLAERSSRTPKRWTLDDDTQRRFELEVESAFRDYEFVTGAALPATCVEDACERFVRLVTDPGRSVFPGPAAAVDRVLRAVLGRGFSPDTMEKRLPQRRVGQDWDEPFGYPGMYFGADTPPTPTGILQSFGGPWFVASALAALPSGARSGEAAANGERLDDPAASDAATDVPGGVTGAPLPPARAELIGEARDPLPWSMIPRPWTMYGWAEGEWLYSEPSDLLAGTPNLTPKKAPVPRGASRPRAAKAATRRHE